MIGPIEYFHDNQGPFYIRNHEMKPAQSLEEAITVLSTLFNLHLFKKTESENKIVYEWKSNNFSKTLTLIDTRRLL